MLKLWEFFFNLPPPAGFRSINTTPMPFKKSKPCKDQWKMWEDTQTTFWMDKKIGGLEGRLKELEVV